MTHNPDLKISSAQHTVCPRGSNPFYVVSYYIKWVTTSRTYSNLILVKPSIRILIFETSEYGYLSLC